MKPRETGGNITRRKTRIKAKVKAYSPPPTFKPEATRPVTPKQRKAINTGVERERKTALANKVSKNTARNYGVDQVQQRAADLNRGHKKVTFYDPQTGISTSTKVKSSLLRKRKVIVKNGQLYLHTGSVLGLGGGDMPLEKGDRAKVGVDAATKAVTAPVVKVLHVVGTPGREIGKQTGNLAKSLGAPKGVQTGARLFGEFALDPTTYLTGGLGKVGTKLAEKEAERIGGKALAKGLTEDQAARAAHRAAVQALRKSPEGKGVQIGLRFHVPLTRRTYEVSTSGKTTAKVLGSKPAEKVTGPIRNTLHETVAPDVRPSHLSPAEHEAIRSARRDYTAQRAAGYREAVKLHRAVEKAVPRPADQRHVIDAIEGRTVHALPDHLRPVAETLSRRFDVAYKEEAKRGLSHGRFKPQGPEDAQAYFPHVNNEQLVVGPKTAKRGRTKVEPDHGRGIRKPLSTLRQESPHLFSEDVPTIAAAKAGRSSDRIALSDLWQRVASAGRDLKPDTHIELGSGDAVYKVTPHGLEELGKDGKPDLKAIERALSGKASGRHVVMDRGAVEDMKKAIGSHGLGDTLPERLWDRTQGALKIAVTIPNPGYHSRNLVGDSSNAFLADTRLADFKRSISGMRALRKREKFRGSASAARGATDRHVDTLLGKELDLGKSGTSTMGRELQLAEQHGAIRTGQAGSEFRDLLGGDPQKLGKVRAVSEYREDFPRFATYLSARGRGMSPQEAADWSRFHHVAYDDLTDFERRVARRFVPFWTWYARNSRIQATKLITRPGKAASIDKILEESAQAAGFSDYQDYAKKNLQDYQQKGLPLPIKFGNRVYNVYVGLPTTDINQIPTSWHDLTTEEAFNLGSRLTFFKAIPEVIANYSIFFRGPIQDDKSPLVPAPDLLGKLPGPLRDKLGVQKFLDKRSGKRVWGWPAKVDYVARQLPQTTFLTQFGTSVAGSRGYDRTLGAISYGTGAKIAPADPTTVEINARYEERTRLDNKLGAIRQRLGKTTDGHYRKTEETQKLQRQIAAVDKEIGRLRTKRKDPAESIPLNQRTKVLSEAERAHNALMGSSDPKLQAEIDRAHKALTGGDDSPEIDRAFKALTGG